MLTKDQVKTIKSLINKELSEIRSMPTVDRLYMAESRRDLEQILRDIETPKVFEINEPKESSGSGEIAYCACGHISSGGYVCAGCESELIDGY